VTIRTVQPQSTLRGTIRVPGDKSASHRAYILSALADGESSIVGLSPGHDVQGTGAIMTQLGATVRHEGQTTFVTGPSKGLVANDSPLDCGNSGTTIRLLCGVASAITGHHTLIGDPSLSRRPMDRVAVPLRQMGATIAGVGERELPPVTIRGSALHAISYDLTVPSAQVKSAILLAGLFADGETTVGESVRTRTTTEDMLRAAGVTVESTDEGAGRVVRLAPGRPQPRAWVVPTDPSQAAFFCVLGLLARDADIVIEDIEASAERIGFAHVLRRMGASLEGDIVDGMVTLRATSSSLTATTIDAAEIPSVDEAPILTIAAAAASGTTTFRDMGELRLKESDRFEGCLALARAVGATAWSEGDDFFVTGLGSASAFSPFDIAAGLDHRIVMSSAVAGAAGQGCSIEGVETVASSYPHFFEDLESLV